MTDNFEKERRNRARFVGKEIPLMKEKFSVKLDKVSLVNSAVL